MSRIEIAARAQTQTRVSWFQRHSHTIAVYIGFVLFAFFIGFPFYYIVTSSFTPRHELFNMPPRYFPRHFTLDNYRNMMESVPFTMYFRNSLIFAIGSAIISVIASAMAAYALARIRFPGSNVVYMLLILSSALPQISVLVPLFQTYQQINQLSSISPVVKELVALVILMSSLILPFTILILVSFIMQVPPEIEEAALIDGANITQVLTKIVLPLILPGVSTMAVINFIISWNEFLYPLVFAQHTSSKTLSVALVELSSDASTYTRPWDMLSALSVFMVIPVMLLVLFAQRMIIAGLSRGAVK